MTGSEAYFNLAWVVLFAGGAALLGVFGLSLKRVKVGPVEFHLGMTTLRGLTYLILGPAVVLWVAGLSILRANGGEWQPGDFRSSVFFVDFCWFLVLVVAPLSALWGAGILVRSAWYRRHGRAESRGSPLIRTEDIAARGLPSSGATGKKHRKRKREI